MCLVSPLVDCHSGPPHSVGDRVIRFPERLSQDQTVTSLESASCQRLIVDSRIVDLEWCQLSSQKSKGSRGNPSVGRWKDEPLNVHDHSTSSASFSAGIPLPSVVSVRHLFPFKQAMQLYIRPRFRSSSPLVPVPQGLSSSSRDAAFRRLVPHSCIFPLSRCQCWAPCEKWCGPAS